ncbi:MAG: GAF domain-containing protein [Deltaproteobacteria bacterium]|nr:GAF domain-containing protein [Deltaproteobacteria bacterium]
MKKAESGTLALYRKKLGIMGLELRVYRGEIGGLAVKGASRSSVLGRLLDYAVKVMEARAGALYLLDRETGGLIVEAGKGGPSGRKAMEAAKEAMKSGRPYTGGLKSGKPGKAAPVLAVPIKRKRKVIGVIEVSGRKNGEPFSKADLQTMASLSRHFSIIMERADLVTELDGRITQFATLNEVGNLLISTLDQAVIRHRAMESITRLMRAETGSLLLVDRERNELYFEVALGEKGKKLKEVRLSIGEGIAGWVAKHGKPLIIHDVSKDRRFQCRMDRRSRFRTRDMVCVPVTIKGNTIGVLQAINRIGGSFNGEDLKLFQMFSNQVAIALDNARLYEEILDTFYATSGALAEAIEKRDPYTGGHTRRVLGYCLAAAKYLKMPPRSMEVLKLSAVLHDIGKIGIEDSILRKNAPLDREESMSMRMHPQYGAEILGHIPQIKDVVPGMLHHHERVDGLGYPDGLKGDGIPLAAKIIAVADTYDAMTTTRPYRKGLPPETALAELKKFSGIQFDEKVVKAFLKAFRNGEIDGVNQQRLPEIGQRAEAFLRL